MPTPSSVDLVRAHLLGSADVMRRTAESAAEDLGRAAEFENLLDRKRERPGLRELAWIEGDSGITPHSGLGSRSPHQYRAEQPQREAPIRSLEWT